VIPCTPSQSVHHRISRTALNAADIQVFNKVCYHPCKLEPIAKWKLASATSNHVTSLESLVCKDQNYVRAFTIPGFSDEPVVYKSCLGNEYAALHNRYLKDTPQMHIDVDTFELVYQELKTLLLKDGPIKPISIEDFLMTKKGALGNRYLQAAQETFVAGFNFKRDSKVSPFIKNEKYFDATKPPRLVYSRDPKFNILFAKYLLPIEHSLVKNVPQVAKGKNLWERGAMFQELVYGEWYAENDMSKFEASQRHHLIEMVQGRLFHDIYGEDELLTYI